MYPHVEHPVNSRYSLPSVTGLFHGVSCFILKTCLKSPVSLDGKALLYLYLPEMQSHHSLPRDGLYTWAVRGIHPHSYTDNGYSIYSPLTHVRQVKDGHPSIRERDWQGDIPPIMPHFYLPTVYRLHVPARRTLFSTLG